MKRLIAQTSIEFDKDLQPFLINGYDLLPLNDIYIKLSKQILMYLPILPTNERIYDIALYLAQYDDNDIADNISSYVEQVKNYLIDKKLLNEEAQSTITSKKKQIKKANLIDKRNDNNSILLDKRTNILDKITLNTNTLSTVIQPPGVTTYNEEQNYNSAYPTDQVPYGNSDSWINK